MGIRMLPIGSIFSRFNRLVRDLSRELKKEIHLVTEGGDTELDKTVIENLNDPLVHIVRNSVDHGIESPEQRIQAGKPAAGTVRLSAIHSGAYVLIRVEDDGKGLDPDKLRQKAQDKGLIPPDADLSPQELYNLVFAPGFSTAEKISNISGRGVGMDVVKKSIDALRGSVDITSQPGRKTVLTIKLPLTLAIIDGFLVECSGEQFVLPLSTVKECVKLNQDVIEKTPGRQIINIRNEIVPYFRLRDVFGLLKGTSNREQVVITEIDQRRVGMVVDQVIGQSQVVIKSLGAIFQNVAEFSGATILGNGKVVPILDVSRLLDTAKTTFASGIPGKKSNENKV
jgi:two-component system chemotaxis sensor kinase CheA